MAPALPVRRARSAASRLVKLSSPSCATKAAQRTRLTAPSPLDSCNNFCSTRVVVSARFQLGRKTSSIGSRCCWHSLGCVISNCQRFRAENTCCPVPEPSVSVIFSLATCLNSTGTTAEAARGVRRRRTWRTERSVEIRHVDCQLIFVAATLVGEHTLTVFVADVERLCSDFPPRPVENGADAGQAGSLEGDPAIDHVTVQVVLQHAGSTLGLPGKPVSAAQAAPTAMIARATRIIPPCRRRVYSGVRPTLFYAATLSGCKSLINSRL